MSDDASDRAPVARCPECHGTGRVEIMANAFRGTGFAAPCPRCTTQGSAVAALAAVDDTAALVASLRARVAELERERDAARADRDAACDELDRLDDAAKAHLYAQWAAEAERDEARALAAQALAEGLAACEDEREQTQHARAAMRMARCDREAMREALRELAGASAELLVVHAKHGCDPARYERALAAANVVLADAARIRREDGTATLVEIVHDLAASEPFTGTELPSHDECAVCGATSRRIADPAAHRATCAWVRARAAVVGSDT